MIKKFAVVVLLIFVLVFSGCSENQKIDEVVSYDNFIAYSESEFNQLKGQEPVLLFFHADWCGTCKILEDAINENNDQIPEGVTILKVDFDKETELKKEYGILLQSMFVVFDKDGDLKEKLAAPSFEDLLISINSVV